MSDSVLQMVPNGAKTEIFGVAEPVAGMRSVLSTDGRD